DAKRDWLAAADAFVLPSLRLSSGRTEGTPTTLLEALSAGLPVVASEVGGVPDVCARDKSALLVAPGDVAALRDAVSRLAGDAALRKRLARAAKTVAKRYTWDAIAPNVEALLIADSPA